MRPRHETSPYVLANCLSGEIAVSSISAVLDRFARQYRRPSSGRGYVSLYMPTGFATHCSIADEHPCALGACSSIARPSSELLKMLSDLSHRLYPPTYRSVVNDSCNVNSSRNSLRLIVIESHLLSSPWPFSGKGAHRLGSGTFGTCNGVR